MGTAFDLTGRVFSRLTAVRRSGAAANRAILWHCSCSCGNTVKVTAAALVSGNTKSCGCLKIDKFKAMTTKHGHACSSGLTPTYHSWAGMKARCSNPKHSHWKHYGGKGVRVCDRWQTFENFLEDMGVKPERCSIDRIEGNGDYSPDNCRWATPKQQRLNRKDVIFVTAMGKTLCLHDWARELGIHQQTLYSRITKSGWTPEQAVTTKKYGKPK